jgi:redox-sensitive bicupin YhaK (pirin superfamily)
MITLRPSAQRGYADHGWLKSFHSFSFADDHDSAHMGFGNLRVINEDRIAPGTGFGTHAHRDMEIVSYVLDGELAHKDSLGTGSTIVPGDVQRMTAGSGVRHSEFNHAEGRSTHFLQIWLLPSQRGLAPGYEQRHFEVADKRGRLALLAAPHGREGQEGREQAQGAVHLNADARLWAGCFDGDESAQRVLDPGRKAYVFLARGALRVNGQSLKAGDAVALSHESLLTLDHGEQAEVLVFDLAP